MLIAEDSTKLITMTRFPRPGCWFRFTPADWNFIRDTLAHDERGKEGFNAMIDDPDAVPIILDNDRLFDAVMVSRKAAMLSPELFFFIVVRHSLKEFGIKELAVADYMAVVCADFGCTPTKGPEEINHSIDSLYSVDYLEAIENASRHHKFFLHVQCANLPVSRLSAAPCAAPRGARCGLLRAGRRQPPRLRPQAYPGGGVRAGGNL